MAGRIQGITVEIGGDTTKLQTALKGVNTEIRNTQSQLRDVDKLLKLDPGNTELLAQKHRLLGDAVKETKEKLETLKTAAEQAEQALKDGTITQEQYDGLQREIVETEQKLKALEEQARQSGTALQEIAAKNEFQIYDIEKTVVDIVFYREKVDIEETREILINYLKRKEWNLICTQNPGHIDLWLRLTHGCFPVLSGWHPFCFNLDPLVIVVVYIFLYCSLELIE